MPANPLILKDLGGPKAGSIAPQAGVSALGEAGLAKINQPAEAGKDLTMWFFHDSFSFREISLDNLTTFMIHSCHGVASYLGHSGINPPIVPPFPTNLRQQHR